MATTYVQEPSYPLPSPPVTNLDEYEDRYPETFFNVKQPDAPWTAIEFRQVAGNDLGNDADWISITGLPNNFFQSMTIEDESGFQKIELVLVDKYFSQLENIITKSVISVRLRNQTNPQRKTNAQEAIDIYANAISAINLRVRFGYANPTDDSNSTWASPSSFQEGDWTDRLSCDKTIIRSPWIYFQILNIVFGLTDYGLQATITGISTMDSILTKLGVKRQFAFFKETPIEMLEWARRSLKQATEESLDFEYIDMPESETDADNKTVPIEVSLGTDTDKNGFSTRSMKSFLDEVCSKVMPKTTDMADVDTDGNPVRVARLTPYTYLLKQEEDNVTNKTTYKLNFFYPNPLSPTNPQKSAGTSGIIRNYVWREYGKTIIRNLSISSKVDWAALNAPIFVTDMSKTPQTVSWFVGKNIGTDSANVDIVKFGETPEQTKELDKAIKDADFSFVAMSAGAVMPGSDKPAERIAFNVLKALNDGVFEGTITLPGDPFWLFDDKLRPFQYMIKVTIRRPGFVSGTTGVDNTGYTETSSSYLSGYYAVKKITHRLDNSGFETNLDIMRWAQGSNT